MRGISGLAEAIVSCVERPFRSQVIQVSVLLTVPSYGTADFADWEGAVLLPPRRQERLGRLQCLNLVFRKGVLRDFLVQVVFKQGETNMGEKGKKDKGTREKRKKAQHT